MKSLSKKHFAISLAVVFYATVVLFSASKIYFGIESKRTHQKFLQEQQILQQNKFNNQKNAYQNWQPNQTTNNQSNNCLFVGCSSIL